jgi:uncharacterized protein (TIGR03437 family)
VKAQIFLLTFAALSLWAESPPSIPAPFYTPSSIVNAANFKAGPLAPNTIGTLYGRDLAFVTRAVTREDLSDNVLPTTLPGSGVRLLIDGRPAFLYFVSPSQINFLVPPSLDAGPTAFQLVLDGRAAQSVVHELTPASPALFNADPETAVSTHLDASVVTADNPARPGEVIVLYATGLGATKPRLLAGQMPSGVAWIARASEFQVTIDGVPVAAANILYAGAAPGYAGLYQINLKLPATLPANPEIRIGFGQGMSPSGVRLPAKASNP